MAEELNLFGDMQERFHPHMEALRVRFEAVDPECSGICFLTRDELEEENPIKVTVIEWIEEPDWMLAEMEDHPKNEMWIVPAYECEVEP